VTTERLMARRLKKHRWIKSLLKCFVLVESANVDTWRFWPGPYSGLLHNSYHCRRRR